MALLAIMLYANFTACSSDPIVPEVTVEMGSEDYFAKNVNFDFSSGEKTFSFNSNVDWTISVAETKNGNTWCTVVPNSGKAGVNTVRIKVEENDSYNDRRVVLSLVAGSLTKNITITQKQRDALLLTNNKFEVDPIGGRIDVEVKSNVDYEVVIPEIYQSWISQSSESRGLATSSISFDIAETEELDKREGEIVIKSGNLSETIHVYQTGQEILLLTQNEYAVSDKGETITVEIKSNFSFDVEMPKVDWIVEETGSRGLSSHTLYYTISSNDTYDSREAEIVYYDRNSSIKDTLKIVQAQKDAIILSQKDYVVGSEGEIIEVNLAANVDVEISMSDVAWIEQVESRTLTENTLYFSVARNDSVDDRTARILFLNKESNIEETLKIQQKGKKVLLMLPDGKTFRSTVGKFLNDNSDLKKIKFVANSAAVSENILITNEDGVTAFLVTNGDWLEIHTSAEEFIANEDCSDMFSSGGLAGTQFPLEKIEVLEFGDNFDTSYVVDMSRMFAYCCSLISLDISDFNTENVTDMGAMFCYCDSLVFLDVSNFNTENVTDMLGIFADCRSLTFLDISGFNTDNVEDMGAMFQHCYSLTSLDVSHFNTKNVKRMTAMFSGCRSLVSLDVSNFNTGNVTRMGSMFHDCNSLTLLDVSNFNTDNVVDMAGMFSDCRSLVTLDVNNFNTAKVENMKFMFQSCYNLQTLDLYGFSFKQMPNVDNILMDVGLNISNKPISILISNEGYNYLTEKGVVEDSFKFVDKDGTAW